MKVKGFTLIEMVLALIVSGILLLGIANFTNIGVTGYFGSVERYRLQTEATFVLEKMSREIRHAVPNMFVDDNSNCVSFYPILDSGFYAVSGADINFIVSDTDSVSGAANTQWLVINPTRTTVNLNDLENAFQTVDAESIDDNVFSLTSGALDLVGNSVSNRHFVFNENEMATYCINGPTVTRNGTLITDKLAATGNTLTYQPATVQNSGIVNVTLTFEMNGESSTYNQDIQVINVP
ncbi:type II secretion system protein J [Vibrio sp. TBV020]|uniref:type II secretion system protein J n=1 Tax=Vibrio sp. TBV020 TaxID=3137398 RepID=UPI0038CD9B7A